ncbi:MAG: mannonate dehydratase, partial [Actinomycetes bacterium]
MKMGFRWFGSADDPIPLAHVRQIPGVSHVVGAVYDVPVGEVWPSERIAALKGEVEASGLALEVVESVNVHDAIKIGLPSRDRYIENYVATIKNLSEHGVKVICYNFMLIFDWIRTDLRQQLPDGSFAMAYDQGIVEGSFEDVVVRVQGGADGFLLPGWELDRLTDIQSLFDAYAGVGEEQLRANFSYFVNAIIDACEKYDVRMAVHPDDPPRSVFGIPRIVKNVEDMRRIEAFVDSPYHGFTVCTGSLGGNPDNDVPALLREFSAKDRVPFVHLRNIK